MKLTKFILVVALNVLVSGTAMGQDSTLNDYFPIGVGDLWQYEAFEYPTVLYTQVEVLGDTIMWNGKTYRIFETTGHYSQTRFFRVDSGRVYRFYDYPDSCDGEELEFDLTLPDSSIWQPCFLFYDDLPALFNTTTQFYSRLNVTAPTKLFWAVLIYDPADTLWGSIPFNATWLAQGIGVTRVEAELAAPQELTGCIIDGVQYGTITGLAEQVSSPKVPSPIVLLGNYPNPFNPTTIIRFHQRVSGWVDLTVFDLLGRKVSTVLSGFQGRGEKQVLWHGRDSNGHLVPSGVYFYRLEFGKYVKSGKMLLLK